MSINTPFVVIGTILTILVFAFGVRRLLGLRLSIVRTVVAGLISFFCASPIITAIGSTAVTHDRNRLLPGLWFVILGVAISLLVGMTFLVIAEALVPSGSLPGPIYLLRGARQRLRRTRRYSQISRILLTRGLLPYQRGPRSPELATPDARFQLARSLRMGLEDGGVTFVKLGQVLSTRRDLLPAEFVDELSRLQDDAPRVPWEEIEPVLTAALGREVSEVFASFEQEPLAAASIAQVHAATLVSGEQVVVKVRRPGVDRVVASDLDIVARLARRLQEGTTWGRSLGTVNLAKGFADALHEELDLRVELSNMLSVAAGSPVRGPVAVHVPTPYRDLCSAQILVMERLEGRPIAQATEVAEERRKELAVALLDSVLRQVMVDGTFHADPHPGNVFLLDDGGLGLLDFGSVGRIDAALRAGLQRLLLSLDRGDPAGVSDALLEIVERSDRLDQEGLERDLGRFMARFTGPSAALDARMFSELFRIISSHGLAVPSEVAAVFRALATLEGTLTQLSPGFDIVAASRRFATRYLAEQLAPDSLRRTATDELIALVPTLRRLPRRIDRIGDAVEHGRLAVNVRLLANEEDRRFVTRIVHQVLLTVLCATSGIMAVLMLGLKGGPTVTPTVSLFEFLGYSFLVVAAILALRVLVRVFHPDSS